MRDQAPNSRLFSNLYTPHTQRAIVEGNATVDDYVSQLRFDSLLARQVVIPDTYLLDGRFFLEVSPEHMFGMLGLRGREGDGTVELALRSQTLERCLAEMLEVPDRNSPGELTLSGFPFNFLSDSGARDRLAQELKAAGISGLTEMRKRIRDQGAARGLATFLRERLNAIGDQAAASELDLAERGWMRWITAVDSGQVQTRRYNPRGFGRSLRPHMELEPPNPARGSMAAQIVEEVSQSAHRADVAELIRKALKDAPLHEQPELVYLDGWYTRSRHRALASQHRCTLARTEAPESAPRLGPLQHAVTDAENGRSAEGTPVIALPDHFIRGLRGMPAERFGEVKRASQHELHLWWTQQDTSALATVVGLLDNAFEVARTPRERDYAVVSVLASIGAAVAAVGVAREAVGNAIDIRNVPIGVWAAIVSTSARAAIQLAKPTAMRRQVVEYGLWRVGNGRQ